MSVFKDKWNGYNGDRWRVEVYYKDWKGERKRHEKRGFTTKKAAVVYEQEFMAKKTKDINMGFSLFIDIYLEDIKPQIKDSTFATKENIIETHIRPYFKELSLSQITSMHILQWQNDLLSKRDENGRPYKETFLRTIQNQLNAIFNHAVKYYDLPKNPCGATKKLGKANAKEMEFWTQEEYQAFAGVMKDTPISYYAFQLLYWTGIRCGELLALTREDFDLEKKTLRINKTYSVIKGKEYIRSPKTEKSNRVIDMPDFLVDEMEDFFESIYKLDKKSRLFNVTKSHINREMDRGSALAKVKRIRVHDLRHSSCALLIHLGYSPIQIADRLGHESVTITERYSHLYPSVQKNMAESLNNAFKSEEEEQNG